MTINSAKTTDADVEQGYCSKHFNPYCQDCRATLSTPQPTSDADELVGLAVWCVSIADHHADVLSPRQIEKLYAASDALRALSTPQPTEDSDTPLVEAVARALYGSLNGSPTCYRWDDSGLDDEHPGSRNRYYRQAQAAIPMVRRAVLAEIAGWLRGPAFSTRHPEDAAFARHVATAIESGEIKA